jgi:lipopolysaccharide transport system permease protein
VADATRITTIEPTRGWAALGLGELARHRELLWTFTWRNVLVRYKQTALGAAWALLQPVFLMIVFTIFFHRLGGQSSGTIPYPLFVYAGLLPWLFFANSVTQSALSLVGNQNLLRKVYFPRLIIPLSTVLTALVDFLVASTVLAGLMIYYGVYPEPVRLVLLPALVLLAFATALGVGLWLSALNVRFRDVQYIVPFLAQVWLFLTPAIYAGATFSEPWQTVLGLNPMQGVVAGFRWALLSEGEAPGPMVLVSVVVTLVLLVSGLAYFRRTERTFADIV